MSLIDELVDKIIIPDYECYQYHKESLEVYEQVKGLNVFQMTEYRSILIKNALLQYRRENNIFEDNDFIVHVHDCENSMLFKVKEISDSGYSYGNDWGWYSVISDMGVGYTFRHASDKEIAQGYRDE